MFFCFVILIPPTSTLFPYTTLFRSSGFRHAAQTPRKRLKLESNHRHQIFVEPVQILWRWLDSDRKSTRLNSSHTVISYAVFCLKKKKRTNGKPLYVAAVSSLPCLMI